MSYQHTKKKTIRKIIYFIRSNQWQEPILTQFFRDPTVKASCKFNVMFIMSKKNLKFPQLINEGNDLCRLYQQLANLFGTKDKPLSLLHIIASVVSNISNDVIEALIDIHGKETIDDELQHTGLNGDTILHYAFVEKASIDVIKKIIDIGGRDLVMKKDNDGYTALHDACIYHASSESIENLIMIGGRSLVMEKGNCGRTALHYACYYKLPIEIIAMIIEVGGKDLVMIQDSIEGKTALHIACSINAPFNLIKKLVHVGGKELLFAKSKDWNPFFNNESGNNEFKIIALHLLLTSCSHCWLQYKDSNVEKCSFLLLKGIEYQVRGDDEFSIGGLFSFTNETVQKIIYQIWGQRIDPCLEIVSAKIKDLPILHAAISAKAPYFIIRRIINRYDNSIATKDSMGRYPIDVAVASGMKWNEGMNDILYAFSYNRTVVQMQGGKRSPINVAALHGLKWHNGMDQVAKASGNEHLDLLTGLHPFMLAAAITEDAATMSSHFTSFDLDSIFELMRDNPQNVTIFHKCSTSVYNLLTPE